MGFNCLRIISDDPAWTPEPPIAERFAAAAREMFAWRSEQVSVGDRGEVVFVDPGELFEEVRCPNCGSAIDIGWWKSRMREAHANGFTDLRVKTPCCGSETSLNDLDYRPAAGFARFIIEVRNLEYEYAQEEEMAELSAIAGRPLRQIAAHY
jgi:hypothetical protein